MQRHFAILSMMCIISLIHGQTTSIQVKAYLQGAYVNGGSMSTLINNAGHLPLNQPYNTPPWNYQGSEQMDTIPANMVDWVLLELRDDYNNSLGFRAAILLTNGSIVDTNLGPDISFPGIGAGSYYLLVDHRNHLPVMSASAISTPSANVYDFSDTLNFPAIGGKLAQKELESGVFGLIAGDVNKDGVVKYSGPGNDRNLIIQRIVTVTGSTFITNTTTGYYPEDLNQDGVVKYSGPGNDPQVIIQSLIGMTGSTSITATYSTPPLVPPAPVVVFTCGDTLVDPRDGQQYPTVQIGTQCWMAKNLNIGTMVNSINTGSTHSDVTNDSIIGKYCFNNDQANCAIYGGLYDWNEMMGYLTTAGVQGICPGGWHIPTDAEWCTLTTFLDPTVNCGTYGGSGTDAGGQMKEAGFDHWEMPNTGATNSSGFTALGAGYRGGNGNFSLPGNDAIFWSSSEDNLEYGIGRNLSHTSADVVRSNILKSYGFSVRCLADTFEICTPQPDQANAGPDSLNIPGDSLQLQANTPVVGSGKWTVKSGNGGVFSDSTSATSWFYGIPDSTYILVWTISTQCGSSSDTVVIGFATPQVPFTCGDTLTDPRDGQQYPTVQIGTQCWMAKNLNVGTMVNSIHNSGVFHSEVNNDSIIEKYCYNNDSANCAVYGGLYDWNEAMGYATSEGSQGICPTDWHIPSDEDWTSLMDTLGGSSVAGGKMKATTTTYWVSPNIGATNSSGYTALGAGWRNYDGSFGHLRSYAFFWSSAERNLSQGYEREMYHGNAVAMKAYGYKMCGFSVRCLRN